MQQATDSQVSVRSWYPPRLDSFHGTFFSNNNTDVFIPVGAVTLGLGRAMRTARTT